MHPGDLIIEESDRKTLDSGVRQRDIFIKQKEMTQIATNRFPVETSALSIILSVHLFTLFKFRL